MSVEVTTPDRYLGEVIGDLNSRRASITEMVHRDVVRVIHASVPLAEMFGYATALRSLTQGRATYTMQFHLYEAAPKDIVEHVMGIRA